MTKPLVPPPIPARLQQIKDFLSSNKFDDAELSPLAGDASFRRYVRVSKGKRIAMLMDAPPEKEDVGPYMRIAEHLYNLGYSAPKILASDKANGLLLLEDFGDETFTRLLKKSTGAKKKKLEQELYEAAVDLLAEWHRKKHEVADRAQLPLPDYHMELLMQEVRLFADWYLPQVVGKEQAAALKSEYMTIWKHIIGSAKLATNQWVHRDYHADNLMWLPARKGLKRLGLLDFQDGVYGDAAYDVVSLLEDARRDIPENMRRDLLARYIEASGANKQDFLGAYAILGAQRNSKIVGIFVRLGARDDKYGYLNYLPLVWEHLERDLAHPALEALKSWLDKHVPAEARGVITVRHTSRELALTA